MTADTTVNPPSHLRSIAREGLDMVKTVAIAGLVVLVLKTAVFQLYTIPSSSMEPGLETGDYIVASTFDYGWGRAALPFGIGRFDGRLFARQAKRGDVVVFRLPHEPRLNYVKRIIGLPGDRVRVSGGRLSVNGVRVAARKLGPAVDHDAPQRSVVAVEEKLGAHTYLTFDAGPGHPGDDTATFLVPEGHYFMMGDNRDNSIDSRWPGRVGVGFVPADNVVGRARLILASWKDGASLFKPWTWLSLEPDRFLKPVG